MYNAFRRAGVMGFEPMMQESKSCAFTAWRHPNIKQPLMDLNHRFLSQSQACLTSTLKGYEREKADASIFNPPSILYFIHIYYIVKIFLYQGSKYSFKSVICSLSISLNTEGTEMALLTKVLYATPS